MRVVLATLLTLPGCSSDMERSVDWVVAAHRGTGAKYSALSQAGADSLVGHRIHLGSPTVSGEDRCERPTFVERRVAAGPFMVVEHESTAGRLGLDDADSVSVVEVLCDGSPWSALGGKVIFTRFDLGFAPWENRLFIVRPQRSP